MINFKLIMFNIDFITNFITNIGFIIKITININFIVNFITNINLYC